MLRSELESDFLLLVDADHAASMAGQREEFVITRAMGRHGARLIHPQAQNHRIALSDLEEMNDVGVIKLTMQDPARGRFRITADGHRHAKEIRARDAPPGTPAERGALDWDGEVFPVLLSVYRAYSAAPAPMGVRQAAINERLDRGPGNERTARVLEELATSGYIEATQTAWQASGPLMCKLTEKGLQHVANWPSGSGDALATALLKALDQEMDEVESDAERTRLERLREAATAVGVNTLSSVFAKLATGGF